MRVLIARLADAYPGPVKFVDMVLWRPEPDVGACREIQALGRKAIPYLVEGLHHEDFKVRRGCAEMLVAIPTREGVKALIACLLGEGAVGSGPSASVVHVALHRLTGHSSALPPGPLGNRDDLAVRDIWAEWWERNGSRLVDTEGGIALRQDDGTLLPLPVGQSYPDGQIPHRVAALLFRLNATEAPVREAAARELGEIGDPCAVTALTITLQDKTWLVRLAAAQALGAIGSAEAIRALEIASEDENNLVRSASRAAIEKIKSRK